mgnify:CR=1 FL=1
MLDNSINSEATILGFDFGTKRIGVAIGQQLTGSARPLITIIRRNKSEDWNKIEQLFIEWGASEAVVGVPLNMAGEEQEMSRLASKFSNQLRGRLNIIVHEIDERMTSIEAEQIIRDNNRNNQGKKLCAEERDIDAVAATQILQSWLNN